MRVQIGYGNLLVYELAMGGYWLWDIFVHCGLYVPLYSLLFAVRMSVLHGKPLQ